MRRRGRGEQTKGGEKPGRKQVEKTPSPQTPNPEPQPSIQPWRHQFAFFSKKTSYVRFYYSVGVCCLIRYREIHTYHFVYVKATAPFRSRQPAFFPHTLFLRNHSESQLRPVCSKKIPLVKIQPHQRAGQIYARLWYVRRTPAGAASRRAAYPPCAGGADSV